MTTEQRKELDRIKELRSVSERHRSSVTAAIEYERALRNAAPWLIEAAEQAEEVPKLLAHAAEIGAQCDAEIAALKARIVDLEHADEVQRESLQHGTRRESELAAAYELRKERIAEPESGLRDLNETAQDCFKESEDFAFITAAVKRVTRHVEGGVGIHFASQFDALMDDVRYLASLTIEPSKAVAQREQRIASLTSFRDKIIEILASDKPVSLITDDLLLARARDSVDIADERLKAHIAEAEESELRLKQHAATLQARIKELEVALKEDHEASEFARLALEASHDAWIERCAVAEKSIAELESGGREEWRGVSDRYRGAAKKTRASAESDCERLRRDNPPWPPHTNVRLQSRRVIETEWKEVE